MMYKIPLLYPQVGYFVEVIALAYKLKKLYSLSVQFQ